MKMRALPASPTFEEFVALKAQEDLPGLDLTETRMARVLASKLTDPETLELPATGYRCHVAEEWLACFGFPATWKSRALVGKGVRQSLAVLLGHYAAMGFNVALPSDVYPVYENLATAAGGPTCRYESLRVGSLESLLLSTQPDVLVVTNPFKPRGTPLSLGELASILKWLAQARHRRVLIDAVYTFDSMFDNPTQTLLATGQAVLLHSLSKGWARPLVAGVTLVPAADVEALTTAFRGLEVDRVGLRIAQGLLRHDRDQPARLRVTLERAAHSLAEELRRTARRRFTVTHRLPGQYLFSLPTSWQDLAAQGVLALPASVFGSSRPDLSIVSSLGFVA